MSTRDQFEPRDCGEFRRAMDSFLADDTPMGTNRALRAHMQSCAGCRSEWEERSRLSSRLKHAVGRQYVPSDLQLRVREKISAQGRKPWWQLEWSRWAIAAAASLVAGFTLWTSHPRTSFPEVADRPGQDAYIQSVSATLNPVVRLGLGDHLHCAIFRKYPQNPPTTAQMLADLSPSYQGLLDLVKANISDRYRVVMAHLCTYKGRQFVHVTFKDGSEIVSLVIARKRDSESLAGASPVLSASAVPLHQAAARGYQVTSFDAGEHLAFIVSQLPAQTNLQIAGRLAPAVHDYLMQAAS